MPLVAQREEDRDEPWKECRYRTFFNTGSTTVRVCEYLPAIQDHKLEHPKTTSNEVGDIMRSYEVAKIPGSHICLTCVYRREK